MLVLIFNDGVCDLNLMRVDCASRELVQDYWSGEPSRGGSWEGLGVSLVDLGDLGA